MSEVIELHKLKVSCENCNLAELCLPRGLNEAELEQLEKTVKRNRPLRKGEYVFRAGDPLRSLFTVRSGCLKLSQQGDDGEEQIIGFYLPGETVGLDGVETGVHQCTAVALDTSSLCALPYGQLTTICKEVPALQELMFRLMGREISLENQLLLTISKKNAEERLATFLSSLSNRYKRLGFSASEFRLSMSRQDIGNYLGLTIETVSRIFGRLQKRECIAIKGKHVQILDNDKLNYLCTNASDNERPSSAIS